MKTARVDIRAYVTQRQHLQSRWQAVLLNFGKVARLTGLEPATPGVTGRYSNQLSYNRAGAFRDRSGQWWRG